MGNSGGGVINPGGYQDPASAAFMNNIGWPYLTQLFTMPGNKPQDQWGLLGGLQAPQINQPNFSNLPGMPQGGASPQLMSGQESSYKPGSAPPVQSKGGAA